MSESNEKKNRVKLLSELEKTVRIIQRDIANIKKFNFEVNRVVQMLIQSHNRADAERSRIIKP